MITPIHYLNSLRTQLGLASPRFRLSEIKETVRRITYHGFNFPDTGSIRLPILGFQIYIPEDLSIIL